MNAEEYIKSKLDGNFWYIERGPHKFCNAETEGTYCDFHRSVMYRTVTL